LREPRVAPGVSRLNKHAVSRDPVKYHAL
jgi:hypothetical protein